MADVSTFDKIRIGIASPEEIRRWSYGEVKKPETINYRTFKPERDGLFCERIFGPVKDWECHCGRYKKVKFKGIVCDRCGVEVTRSKVRRERMGHIELAAPVCHIWYLKGVPSPLSLLLDISPRPLEKVLYFASYIITSVDRARINNEMADLRGHLEGAILDIEKQGQELLEDAKARYERDLQEHETEHIIEIDPELIELTEEGEVPEPIVVKAWTDEDKAYRKKILDEELKDVESDTAERIQRLREGLDLVDTKVEKKLLLAEDDWSKIDDVLSTLDERLPDRSIATLVQAGMGGAAVKSLLQEIDLEKLARELRQEIAQTQGPKRARAIKRLEVADAFIMSKSRPEWMIFDAVPVISPELRPMVQLDGGRFATSDLNDLYRRIINRNNRLKKIVEIKAPESIVNHEKRLLQEAVDALIDNGRRARPVVGSNNRPLKSLSDMLKGKEGRFRKNLLGKRVDYSGRSVIVVGPRLQLHQCGLPKEMAIELFKPFVMKTLVERNYTSNIKTAKRMIDRLKPEVWDALEEVIKEHPVLLNRAPTLHRLGIQAFEPILVDGKAIQIHPLVCHAFNADFDGDQMAVHVPLSVSAQAEARILMLSTKNLFSPANGGPIVSPSKDIVLGSYFLTMQRPGEPFSEIFSGPNEAIMAFDANFIDLQQLIKVRITDKASGERSIRETTVGRLKFSLILPEDMRYVNETVGKKHLGKLIAQCHELHGDERTIRLLDDLKNMGFTESTRSGITVALTDMEVPDERNQLIREAETDVANFNRQYRRGMITAGERKEKVLVRWQAAAKSVGDAILKNVGKYNEEVGEFNPIYVITDSGARGTTSQITQLSGMRGIMSDPFGNMIEDLPVKSNFHEGLSVLEYFVSTHGARKGLADTALRTADAGYLTRRLVDVAQEVIIREDDCQCGIGIFVEEIREGNELIESLQERLNGRYALDDIVHPKTGEVIVAKDNDITPELARQIEEAGVTRVGIRSVLTCEARHGVCAKCYGRDLATGQIVEPGVAVGIIAAQSIGEPGTQLTMRTFHTGGIAQKQLASVAMRKEHKKIETLKEIHEDIAAGIVSFDEGKETATGERERVRAVQQLLKVLEDEVGGLLRVVELFESRKPKGQAIVTEFKGVVAEIEIKGLRRVVIHVDQPVRDDSTAGLLGEVLAADVKLGDEGEVIAAGTDINDKLIRRLRDAKIESVKVRRAHLVPYRGQLQTQPGQHVEPGDRLTEGPLDPQKVLELQGNRGVQQYVVREIQRVYKGQGVDINDKHVEVIVRQMLKKRKIKSIGDTEFLPGQVVDKFEFEDENRRVRQLDPPGTESTSDWMLLGITEASLATESFLAAASFQKTTRVLTEAAVRGKKDNLVGLKENVIIGRLIPAGTGLPQYRNLDVELLGIDAAHRQAALSGGLLSRSASNGDGGASTAPVDKLSEEERDLLNRLSEMDDITIDSNAEGAI
jgi:DNA-directed RNA polymerase subunit beta'